MSWSYGKLASEVYDLDKPIGSSFGDVEYYRDQLSGIDGPVLEPAVGTGRILIPLLEAGITVHGFDSSPDMLDLCRRNCQARGLSTVLAAGDMRGVRRARSFLSGDPADRFDRAARWRGGNHLRAELLRTLPPTGWPSHRRRPCASPDHFA